MRWVLPTLVLGLALSGCKEEETSICDSLCSELVTECEFGAFPSVESCVEGCRYDEEERGVDVTAYAGCVAGAECNQFDVVECQHDFGANTESE